MKASTSGDWRIFAQSATGRTDVADRSRIGERTIAARNDSRSATGKDSNDPSMMLFRPCRDAEATTPCGGALPQERQDKPAVPSYRALVAGMAIPVRIKFWQASKTRWRHRQGKVAAFDEHAESVDEFR